MTSPQKASSLKWKCPKIEILEFNSRGLLRSTAVIMQTNEMEEEK